MPDGPESLANETLRVGVWTVEPALNQLSRGATVVKLEPKAMALLRHLAERPGEVVSRQALLAAVWPGVVVGDDSLTQAVIKLRKALGDGAESPAYIQTIAKRGYRLLAPVSVPASPAAAPAAHDKRRRVWPLIATAVALPIAAAGVWWTTRDEDDIARPAAVTEAARAAQPTVTIAPFEALGDDPRAALLGRGITADLVTDLSTVSGLSVISAVRPGAPQDAQATVAPVASRYLVSGSVQRVDDRLRLHVHLTDAHTGQQLWSERFDRPLAQLFAMQEELVPKLLQTLPAKVSEAELRRVAQPHTRSLEAYEHFQRGVIALLVRQPAENEIAREQFRRAIALDANFARAYAALALTYAADYRNQWTPNGAAALERAFELARTAHEINPDVRETYFVLGLVHLERREHAKAMQYLEEAVRISPSFADAYALMGGIKVYTGDPASALPLVRTAMRLNPEAAHLYFLILGRAYFALGDLEQAKVNLEHALARNPANLETRVYLAALHVARGSHTDAAWQAEEIRALQPDFAIRTWLSTHPLTDRQVQAKLIEALAPLGL